jgi:hypothetical protein
MIGFQQKFLKSLIKEADISAVDNVPAPEEDLSDAEAFDKSLDQGTPAATFDDIAPNPEHDLKQQQLASSIGVLQNWITEVEGFIAFLNGLDEGSVNYHLNKADCDSIMADVRRSESKKVSRLAQDLSSLSEALKQYLLSADNDNS